MLVYRQFSYASAVVDKTLNVSLNAFTLKKIFLKMYSPKSVIYVKTENKEIINERFIKGEDKRTNCNLNNWNIYCTSTSTPNDCYKSFQAHSNQLRQCCNYVNSLSKKCEEQFNKGLWDSKNSDEEINSDFLCINTTDDCFQNEPILNYEFDIPESPESLIIEDRQQTLIYNGLKVQTESVVSSDNCNESDDDKKQCYLVNVGTTNNWNINYASTGKQLINTII